MTLTAPLGVTLGSGSSTLALFVSGRAAPTGNEFIISVDGTQIGAVQTTKANSLIGQLQEFDVLDTFPDGINTVSINYLNANNSLLTVASASIDGMPVPNSALTLSNDGAATFSFLATGALTPVIVGAGPDTVTLTMSERAEPAGAQFTISVDGTQIGGVQTTMADMLCGQSQTFEVEGSFAPGPNTVSIDYLNAGNSVLSVQNATINGTAVADSAITLSNDGSAGFSFTGPVANAPVTVGEGADTLALYVSERGQPAGAQFTVDVDGAQVGGVLTTTADSTTGLTQPFDVLGSFVSGANTVSVNYLNASNSELIVDGATIDGTAVTGSFPILSNIGAAGFTFQAPGPAAAGTTVIGSGPDTLALTLSQRGQLSGALFTVIVDGIQIDGVQSVTANSLTGQTQVVRVLGTFAAGPHTASINYLNASNSLLFVNGATINGLSVPGGTVVLSNFGTSGFAFNGALTAPIVSLQSTSPLGEIVGAGPNTSASSPLTLTQMATSIATTDAITDHPFSVTFIDPNAGQTETVTATLSSAQNGTLTDPNASTDGSAVTNGVWTVTTIPTAITADLNGLLFTPIAHQVTPGSTVSTQVIAAITDTAGEGASLTVTFSATALALPQPAGNDTGGPAGQGGSLLPAGYLSTDGNQIVDQSGNPVRIASIGWDGTDSLIFAPYGLWQSSLEQNLAGIKADGFNTIRIPWTDVMLNNSALMTSSFSAFNPSLDPELVGKTSLQLLQTLVADAGTDGLKVILDHHDDDGGPGGWGGQQANGLWIDSGPGTNGTDGSGTTGTVTASKFLADSVTVAKAFAGNSTVIGFDLDNEPTSAGDINWGQGGPTDIQAMYTKIGDAIEAVDPGALIIAEGPEEWSGPASGMPAGFAEGDLSGVAADPVSLTTPNKVVYSVHEYPPDLSSNGSYTPAQQIAAMNNGWGYLETDNIAPVWVGEIGSNMSSPADQAWIQMLLKYMNGQDGAEGGPTFTGNQQPVSASWWQWGSAPGQDPEGVETAWGSDTFWPSQQGATDQLLYDPTGALKLSATVGQPASSSSMQFLAPVEGSVGLSGASALPIAGAQLIATVTNLSAAATNGWSVELDTTDILAPISGAAFTSPSSGVYIATPSADDAQLNPSGYVSFGFTVQSLASNPSIIGHLLPEGSA